MATTPDRDFRERLRLKLEKCEGRPCRCPRKPVPCGCYEYCEPGADGKALGPVATCDCPCRLPPPCRHVLAVSHDLSLEEWAELLETYDAKEYGDRPMPARPTIVTGRDAKVAAMALRYRRGEGLRHPDDLSAEDTPKLERETILTIGNFRPKQGKLRIAGKKSA